MSSKKDAWFWSNLNKIYILLFKWDYLALYFFWILKLLERYWAKIEEDPILIITNYNSFNYWNLLSACNDILQYVFKILNYQIKFDEPLNIKFENKY